MLKEAAASVGFRFRNLITWVKDVHGYSQTRGCGWGSPYSTSASVMNGEEFILVFAKAGAISPVEKHAPDSDEHGQWMSNVRSPWVMKPELNKQSYHDSVFPEELPRRCISLWTKEGHTVLDPFAGTGTVGAVCMQMQRGYILIEKDGRLIDRSL